MKYCLRRLAQRFGRVLAGGAEKRGNAPQPLQTAPDPISRLSKDHVEAAQRLVDRSALLTLDYKQQRVKTPFDGTHPLVKEFHAKFIKELERRGYPFYAFEFVRSYERQRILFKQGVTRAQPGSSPHQYGCAVDIVHCLKFWDLEHKQWEVLGAIGKEVARKAKIPIVWGGDFRSIWDPAHWELEYWRDLRRAKWALEGRGEHLPPKEVPRFLTLEQEAGRKTLKTHQIMQRTNTRF